MKKGRVVVLIILAVYGIVFSGMLGAQNSTDSIRILGYLPVKHSDEAKWIQRYQGEIDDLVVKNKQLDNLNCDVLCFGSSSMRLWNSIEKDLAPMKIINRAYGGSTVRDQIYNYPTIGRGYNPKMIMIYIENDLGNYKEAITVGEMYDLFRVYQQLIQRDYPDCKLFFLALKPSFLKMDQIPDQLVFNRLMKEYAQRTPNVEFLDITQGMYDSEGNLRQDIFIEDNLHMNEKGYHMWTKVVKPALLREFEY